MAVLHWQALSVSECMQVRETKLSVGILKTTMFGLFSSDGDG